MTLNETNSQVLKHELYIKLKQKTLPLAQDSGICLKKRYYKRNRGDVTKSSSFSPKRDLKCPELSKFNPKQMNNPEVVETLI